jgi:GH24 family phage-related lysozyme (muramidase)
LVQLNNLIKNAVQLNDNQYGALVDLLFNEGYGTLSGSPLITRLNALESPGMTPRNYDLEELKRV